MAHFMHLSDDIILKVFSYVGACDLIMLAGTCRRFEKIARDKTLWSVADFSCRTLTLKRVYMIIQFLVPLTKVLKLRGCKDKTNLSKSILVTSSVLKSIAHKASSLSSFSIIDAYVNASKVNLSDFGTFKLLKLFHIHNCEFLKFPKPSQDYTYLKNIHVIFPHLENLEICNVSWINDYDTYALSKIKLLKRLSLRNNIRIGVTMAYLALSFKFGFDKLESLDMRGTSLCGKDIPCLLQNHCLKELLIGPVGQTRKRIQESYPDFATVLRDPRSDTQPPTQVVVINFGPQGPAWRHVEQHELNSVGLGWLNKSATSENSPPSMSVKNDDDDGGGGGGGDDDDDSDDLSEYDGLNEVEHETSLTPTSQPPFSKRKCDSKESKSKRRCVSNPHDRESESPYHNCLGDVADSDPEVVWDGSVDEDISDNVIFALQYDRNELESLTVAGCSISDKGLIDIIRTVPSLNYLDVRYTLVTEEGIRAAKNMRQDLTLVSSIGTR